LPAFWSSLPSSEAGAALACLHLALWSLGWQGQSWPAHLLPLDLSFTILCALLAWRGRSRLALAPLVALWTHALATGSLVQGPGTMLGWGGLLLGLGFALLLVGVVVTCLLRAPATPSVRPTPPRA
jgi:hypothetical protein